MEPSTMVCPKIELTIIVRPKVPLRRAHIVDALDLLAGGHPLGKGSR